MAIRARGSPRSTIPLSTVVPMSKRTLDSFFLAPSSANSKRSKHNLANELKSKHHVASNSTKIDGMEIVDLDEVIDLNTPSASPSGSIIIEPSDVSGSNVLTLPHAAEVDNGKTLSMQDGTQRNSEKELGIRSSAAQTCDVEHSIVAISPDTHRNYPFPIPSLPAHICQTIAASPVKQPKTINHLPHLDLLSFEPYLDAKVSREYGEFLRRELPFYRVEYKLTRFGKVTDIMTPRYTTVFGVDETSRFTPDGSLVETSTGKPVAKNKYKTAKPRPIPSCLDELRKSVERATETTYNYALVNYYATGSDSISYHSDDEHFLEKEPAIASFSFLGVRDFLLKHKPPSSLKSTATTATATATTAAFAGTNGDPSEGDPAWHAQIVKAAATPLKFSLRPGTLILMRGTTQGNWLHSIPKRAGDGGGGRINITFRRNMTVGGTENYYRYNVGTGNAWKWDEKTREMRLME